MTATAEEIKEVWKRLGIFEHTMDMSNECRLAARIVMMEKDAKKVKELLTHVMEDANSLLEIHALVSEAMKLL